MRRRSGASGAQPVSGSLAPSSAPDHSPLASRLWVRALGLFLVTVLAYLPVMLSGGFVWDDDLHVTNNIITKPHGLWRSWFTTEQPNFWPVTWSVFWAEWKLFGTDPTGYHVVNVLVHAANVLLLWRVLARLALPGAWLAALLFAVHPVNVETAAWITQLKTLLSMLFFLAGLLLFLKSEPAPETTGEEEAGSPARRRAFYGLSVTLFLVAMLAKPAVVTMPVVLLGIAWWRRGRITRRDLLLSLPFFAVAGALAVTEIWFQYTQSIAGADVRSDSFAARLAGAGWVLGFYLSKALLPVNLMTIYPRWKIDAAAPLTWVPLLLFAAAAGLVWWKRRTWGRPVLAGMGYFALTLAPVLGFLNIYYMRYSYVADHYQYVSLPGVLALAAGGGAWLAERRPAAGRRAAVGGAAAVVVLFVGYTLWHQRDYQDLETFYRNALQRNPDAWLARNNLGQLLLERGALDEALQHFTEAARIEPAYAENQANLGAVLAAQGRMDEALAHFRKASELSGDIFELHNRLGETYLRIGQIEEAVKEFERAIALEPRCAAAHDNLGVIALRRNDVEQAIAHFGRAVEAAPRFAQAREHLADARLRSGDEAGAFAAYREAIAAIPEMPQLRNNLAVALAQTGRLDEAIAELREAARLFPSFAPTYKNLGALLARKGELDEARRALREALRLDPSEREAAAVLEQIGG